MTAEVDKEKYERLVREIDLLIQRIIIRISDSHDGSTTAFNPLERAGIPLEQLFAQIDLGLGLVSEWVSDKIDEIPIIKRNISIPKIKTNSLKIGKNLR